MATYSNSKLTCFESCQLKYCYKYIQKIEKPVEETVEQFLGKRVHEILEKLYKDLKFQKQNTLEGILEHYREQWSKNWNPQIVFVRKEYTEENYRKMGEKYIADYFNRYHPFDQSTTIGLEQSFTLSLGEHKMTGIMDRLSFMPGGIYEIHDYKTGVLTAHSYLEEDKQLPLYALAVKHHYHDAKDVRLIWHFLSADKEIILTKTDEQLERLKAEVMQVIGKIEDAKEKNVFPSRKSNLCDWCEFRTICPEFAHIAKTENLSVNEYLNEPGVKLVNQYSFLTNQKQKFLQEIDPKIERLKDALVQYSENNRMKVVMGSDHKATIWSAEVVKVPNKGEDGRLELESLLKKLGIWPDVSSLDSFTLSRILQEKRWPVEFVEKLMPFLRKEKISRIYLKAAENGRE